MIVVRGTATNTHGEPVDAWGFEHDGMFIVNARVSSCGRFAVSPSEYGLTEADADRLKALNSDRNLLAYSDAA